MSSYSEFADTSSDLPVLSSANEWSQQTVDHLKSWSASSQAQKIKALVRKGVPPSLRRRLWITCTGASEFLIKFPSFYRETFVEMFGDSPPDQFQIPGCFNPSVKLKSTLTSAGQTASLRILTVLSHLHPDVHACPLLAPIITLLLHFMTEEECFACATSLLTSKDISYMDQSQKDFIAFKRSLTDLARSRLRSSFRYLLSVTERHLHIKLSLRDEEMYRHLDGWLSWLFSDIPFSSLVRICDCYFVEGPKVFFRAALAILKCYCELQSSSEGGIRESIPKFISSAALSGDEILKIGFGIRRISRRLLWKYHARNALAAKATEMEETVAAVILAPRLEPPSSIIQNQKQWQTIWSWLPARVQVMTPCCVFDTNEHGYSLQTLYRRTGASFPLLFVVKTTAQEVLGGYCPVEIEGNVNKFHYFGTGETFLFSFVDSLVKYSWSEGSKVSYFVGGDRSCFSIGGGESGYGLWFDKELNKGTSSRCDTFCNKPLCSTEEDGSFTIASVEVYSFS